MREVRRRESEERRCQRMLRSKGVSLLLLRLQVTRSPSSILHFFSTLWNFCKCGLNFFWEGALLGLHCSVQASLVAVHGFSGCGEWACFPCGLWDLSSQTRDWTCTPCIGRWIVNPWIAREVLAYMFKWISSLVPFADWVLASMCENHFGIRELSTPALKTYHPSQGKKAKDTQ